MRYWLNKDGYWYWKIKWCNYLSWKPNTKVPRVYRWLFFGWDDFSHSNEIGCHCGCCGKWIVDQESFNGWGLCEKCEGKEDVSYRYNQKSN